MAKRIKVTKTQAEWDLLNQRVKESGKRDFNTFMYVKLRELNTKFNQCPECVTVANGGVKIEKVHYISPDVYKTLTLIAFKMGVSPSTVVDKIILTPLLKLE